MRSSVYNGGSKVCVEVLPNRRTKPLKVVHVITGLDVGGAEAMLLKLISNLDSAEFSSVVVSLRDPGPIGEALLSRGVRVESLGMRRELPKLTAAGELARKLRLEQPDIVQTWMYHANLLGGLAAKFSRQGPVVWNIRTADPGFLRPRTKALSKGLGILSRRLAVGTVYCAESAKLAHIKSGYPADQAYVIPNGFDLETHKPDPKARLDVRSELRLPPDTPLIGMIARFHPQKDHRNFLEAAARLLRRNDSVHFLLCGADMTLENSHLRQMISDAGIDGNLHLLGLRHDIPAIHASLDIATLSSRMEGFPNSIGEAMACAIPCVVTDVGDAATLVGDTGAVVPPSDPGKLSDAWNEMLSVPVSQRVSLGEAARRRIADEFGVTAVADRYGALYRSLSE